MPRGRRMYAGVDRPPCPKGHEGEIQLAGFDKSPDERSARQRYRCVPADGSPSHRFVPRMPARHPLHKADQECHVCERRYRAADGPRTAHASVFAVREAARALVRVGQGADYRGISHELRREIGKKSVRGRMKGYTSQQGNLVMGYLDVLGPVVVEKLEAKSWPPIVALDAWAMRTRIRPKRPNAPQRMWPQVSKPGKASHRKTGKIRRAMKARERGRVLVASGRMPYTGEKHAVLARFAGGGDEESWVEFLRTLAGEPEWVVSDRDQAIINAVARVWPNATHYFCEQHLAHNAGEAAAKDAKGEGRREALAAVDSLLEAAQYSPAHWAAAKREARAQGFPHLVEWMDDNEAVVLNQMMKRRQNGNYWRSAGATEEIIRRIKAALYDRRFVIRNVDRLNITLGLIRADADKQSSETAYSRILREFVRDREGRLDADWRHLHDRRGTSSIDELIHEAELRQQRLRRGRQGRGRSRLYHAKRAAFRAEAEARGVVMGHGPRRHEVPKSVAGTRISDYGWLVGQWHPTRNGTLRPEDVEAGSGTEVWWLCPGATDHEWPAQVRSRTLRGTGCPFCTHRRVAPSGSIAATHPEIAAQWHPTRNGEKCPEHFTFGSHFEAWWQCPAYRTHVWLARVSTRTVMATGCPSCARLAGKGGANKGKKREEPPDEGQGGVSLAS